jgi:GTPase
LMVIIVQRRTNREPSYLGELKALAEAAGYTVISSFEQVREPDPKYQIGAGKAEELARLVKENKAEKIIFDNIMRTAQAYNLAKLVGVEVIDRFQLILEIFSKRASTKEALLQIQLAKLKYELPKSREKVKLARHGEQPGFFGLGKYEVDVYYDAIRRQMFHIKEELKDIRKKRAVQRSRRLASGFALVALAGYTNSGKTTLFNLLTEENKTVSPNLFTTLTTTTRATDFEDKKALLIDTVGFIDRLPIQLIEAFQSTLEETIFSDEIIMVIDASDPVQVIRTKLEACLRTIKDIGASKIPVIMAFNKIDRITVEDYAEKKQILDKIAPNTVFISALKGTNVEELRTEVAKHLEVYSKLSVTLPIGDDSLALLSWLHDKTYVVSEVYSDKLVHVILEHPSRLVDAIIGRVEKTKGNIEDVVEGN